MASQILGNNSTKLPNDCVPDGHGQGCLKLQMSGSIYVKGYWTCDGVRVPAVLHNFPPGIYAVAGLDEWGSLDLLYLVVD